MMSMKCSCQLSERTTITVPSLPFKLIVITEQQGTFEYVRKMNKVIVLQLQFKNLSTTVRKKGDSELTIYTISK